MKIIAKMGCTVKFCYLHTVPSMIKNFKLAMWSLGKQNRSSYRTDPLNYKIKTDLIGCSLGELWPAIGWWNVYNNKEEFTLSSVSFLVASSESTKWLEILGVGQKKIKSSATLMMAPENAWAPNALLNSPSSIFRHLFSHR